MANTAVLDNLRRNIQNVGNAMLQKKMLDQQRKREFQDTIRKALVTAAVSGKVRPKEGAAFSGVDLENEDFGQVLGQLSNLYEPAPAKVSQSYSISQVPFSDVMTARSVLGATEEDLEKKGLATREPNIFGRKPGTGFFGLGFGPGSEKAGYQVSPEFEAMKQDARNLLKNPTRVTQRISNAGTVLGQPKEDASSYKEGTVVEDEEGQKWTARGGQWVKT